MKKGILFLLLAGSFTAKSQSLKDLLYSGKLKTDSNSVVRKTDDLSSKIDTSQKKATEPEKSKLVPVISDSSMKKLKPQADTAVAGVTIKDAVAPADSVTTDVAAPVKTNAAPPVKTNNKIWKEYADSLLTSLKTEVLSSKKVKKETYYLMVDYEIDTAGQVNITNVTASPENAFLQEQVKQRIESAPPQLAPVVDSNNKPRKVKRKYSFNITKE